MSSVLALLTANQLFNMTDVLFLFYLSISPHVLLPLLLTSFSDTDISLYLTALWQSQLIGAAGLLNKGAEVIRLQSRKGQVRRNFMFLFMIFYNMFRTILIWRMIIEERRLVLLFEIYKLISFSRFFFVDFFESVEND